MTTDPFTTTAEQALHEAWAGSAEQHRAAAEAARMWPEDLHLGAHDGIIPTGKAERMLLIQRQAYELGEMKAWIRTQQPPTDAERAVRELHREVIVYELDSLNGTWEYGEDDERVVLRRYCAECSSEDVIRAVEDQDWMEDWGYAHEVDFPCATIQALDSARATGRDAR